MSEQQHPTAFLASPIQSRFFAHGYDMVVISLSEMPGWWLAFLKPPMKSDAAPGGFQCRVTPMHVAGC